MKRVLAAALLLSGFTSQAQTTGQSAVAHAPDGGTMERLQSISILPLINSPFTATVTTVWTKILPDGTTATMANRRTVARDSTGRIFQERRFFAPDGDKKPPRISSLEYADPNRHELYRCFPERKTCYLSTYFSSQMTQIPPGPLDSTPVPKGFTIQREVLGQKTIEDLDVTGSRQIVTLGAGVIGNQKPQPIVTNPQLYSSAISVDRRFTWS